MSSSARTFKRWLAIESSNTFGAWGLLILRVGAGLMVFYIHGWHKLHDGLAYLNTGKPWRLAKEVMEMGFPLPLPSAFAATAVQFVCSLMLIAGLFTRLNAMLLAGTLGDGNIAAWTAASDTGYSFPDAPLKPRLALKASIASGDSNPDDPDLGTFNALFPKGAYFAQTSLMGPANIIDLHPCAELQLASSVPFTMDWDFFWRESTQDGIYGNAVNLVRSGGSSRTREIGNQVQALVEWEIQRHFTFSAAYAHFFAGKFLKETQPGKDVDYVSTWLTFKF